MGHHRIIAAAMLLTVACSGDSNDNNAPCVGKCDGINNQTGLDFDLGDRADPVANFLRTVEGELEGDYRTFLDGVGSEMDCDESTEQTFTILLSNQSFFPRNMVTRCSDDPTKASQFFLSTQSDTGNLQDINPRDLKMIGWDATARKYNTYEVKDDGTGEGPLFVDVEPGQCSLCHTNSNAPHAVDVPFVPVMNELTNPWTLWNAQPDFESHEFDDLIDPTIANADVYSAMVEGDKLGAASDFELITRASIDRVVGARLRVRRDEPAVDKALDLLYPLFCDENANYASENHEAGSVVSSIIIDDAMRQLYFNIRPDNWPYAWVNDDRIRLRSVESGEQPINVIPVRGEATIQVEIGLVSRRSLTPYEVLQVRSLDWKRPSLSDFRCEVYQAGRARVEASEFDLTPYKNVGEMLSPVLAELMYYEDGEDLLSLVPENSESVYALPNEADLIAFVDDPSAYEMDIDDFGATVQTYFDETSSSPDRVQLENERTRRGCKARGLFSSAPEIPGIECDN